jgi:hypothetical protein
MAKKKKVVNEIRPTPGKNDISMKTADKTNFMQLPKSRHKPAAGDIFAGSILGERWVIGRVIRSGFAHGTASNCLLLYLYRLQVPDLQKIETPLLPDLLIPPFFMLSNMLWTRGMVVHVRNAPLHTREVLPRHVFRSMTMHEYVDEEGEPVEPPEPGEVVGKDCFRGWGSLDDEVSGALGVPLHPVRAN